MITSIVVGSGNTRKVIDLVRDRDQRRSLSQAIKRHLFPTQRAMDRAYADTLAGLKSLIRAAFE